MRIALSNKDGCLWEGTKEGNYLEEVWEESMPMPDSEVILGKNKILMLLLDC